MHLTVLQSTLIKKINAQNNLKHRPTSLLQHSNKSNKHHTPSVCCGTHRSFQSNTMLLRYSLVSPTNVIPQSAVLPTGLSKITPYTPPLYCGTHWSPWLTPYPTSIVVPKGLPKLLLYCGIHRSPMPLLCDNYNPYTHVTLSCSMHISATV